MQHYELFQRRMPDDLFQNWPTKYERRESAVQARNREMRKISIILKLKYVPIKKDSSK
jgi:hypothetical protein